jgi:membrane associated rhomboid family serine protease
MVVNRRYQQPEAKAVLALIAINIIFLIALLVKDNLYITLGLQSTEWYKEPWTLVTSLFVHDFPWHILANMFSLYFLGSYLCNIIGDARFCAVYFAGGIIGNFFYILIEHLLGHPNSLAFGASGAIFAVAGAFMMLAPKMKVIVFPIPIPMPLWVAIIGGFLLMSFFPGVAWQAHLGGLIVGLIAGFFLRKRKRNIIMF